MRLSFLTAFRNELAALRCTLPENIKHQISDPEHDFVLLDYGSTDGAEEWIRSEFEGDLALGRIRLFRLPGARSWDTAHALNGLHLLAFGEIHIELASNVVVSPSASVWIRTQLEKHTPTTVISGSSWGVPRKLFLELRGYDEASNPMSPAAKHHAMFRERASRTGCTVVYSPKRFTLPIVESESALSAAPFTYKPEVNLEGPWGQMLVRDHNGVSVEIGHV
jgi:hypothetical protein